MMMMINRYKIMDLSIIQQSIQIQMQMQRKVYKKLIINFIEQIITIKHSVSDINSNNQTPKMQPIDIESIIRKYSQPIKPTTPSQLPNSTLNPLHYLTQNLLSQSQSNQKLTQSYETNSSYSYKEANFNTSSFLKTPMQSSKFSEFKYQNITNPTFYTSEQNPGYYNIMRPNHNQINQMEHRSHSSLFQNKKQLYNPFQVKQNTSEILQLENNFHNSYASKNTKPFSLQNNCLKEVGYSLKTDRQSHYSKYFDKISSQQNHNKQTPSLSSKQYDKQPQITVPQSQLMNVFSYQKTNKLKQPQFLNNQQTNSQQINNSKPSVTIMHHDYHQQTPQQYQSQIHTKTNSYTPSTNYWNPNYQNNFSTSLAGFDPFDPQRSHAQKISSQSHNINNSSSIYKKLEPQTLLKPNHQGFIPLHKTKQQIEYQTCDINSVELQQKQVYDRLQITGKIKTAKQQDFNQNSFCKWNNHIIYDIATNDNHAKHKSCANWC